MQCTFSLLENTATIDQVITQWKIAHHSKIILPFYKTILQQLSSTERDHVVLLPPSLFPFIIGTIRET